MTFASRKSTKRKWYFGFFGNKLTSRRKATMRFYIIGASLCAAIVPLAAFVMGANERDVASSEPIRGAIPVQTLRIVLERELTMVREFTGRIEAARKSQLSFERAGLLTHILVDEGDCVEAGQALARIDLEPLRLRLQQLQAEHAAAHARLAEMEAGPRQERIAASRAQLREREARVELWARELARVRGLFERGAAGDKELQDTSTEHAARVALRDTARAELEELEAGTRVEQMEAQRAEIARLAAAVAHVELDAAKSTLRAPFSGSISARHADEGLVVAAGTPVLDIIETGHLQARVGVAVDLARNLTVGQEHFLVLDEETARATIARILPQLDDATRSATVVFDLSGDRRLHGRPGQTVRLRLEDRLAQRGLWLPIDALIKGERGLWAVYAVVSSLDEQRPGARRVGRLERRDVEILYTESDRVYVRGLLKDGDEVVSSGAHRVVPGQTVAPLPIAERTAAVASHS